MSASNIPSDPALSRARRALLLVALGVTAAGLWLFPLSAHQPRFEHATLAIATWDGRKTFDIEVAVTPAAQMRGLMFRKEVPSGHGMLFRFDPPQHIDMWMKNTWIPLDMIFIDDRGIVAGIAERTEPESTALIPSPGDCRAVLEIGGGEAARNHIVKGDRVFYPPWP